MNQRKNLFPRRSQLQIRIKSATTTNILTNCNFFAPPPPPHRRHSPFNVLFRTLRAILSSVSPRSFSSYSHFAGINFLNRPLCLPLIIIRSFLIIIMIINIVCTRSIPFISCTINKMKLTIIAVGGGWGKTRPRDTGKPPRI